MRSASSTCAGRPEPIRPATYLTRGEYATTSRSRARWSSCSRYRRHRSFSSMALTLVSRTSLSSRPRVTAGVHGAQPGGLYLSVNLRRRERSMSQKLLNRPQIGSSLQKVSGEGVPQPVRRSPGLDGSLAGPHAQPAAHVGGGQPPPGFGEEERRLLAAGRPAARTGWAERGAP